MVKIISIKIKSLTIFILRKLTSETKSIFFFKMKKVNLGQTFRAVFNRTILIHSFYFESPISFFRFFPHFSNNFITPVLRNFLSFIVKKFSNIDKIFSTFPNILKNFS